MEYPLFITGKIGYKSAMNQDQVKEKLLQIEPDVAEFSVIFSGKSSKVVNGLYTPATHEIIIHNKNFAEDNGIMYTAIHEFAHHVHNCTSPLVAGRRAHTTEYWDIFHRLLEKGEKLGLYTTIFETEPRFVELTRKIKEQFLSINGNLMKDLGRILLEAHQLCKETQASYDDFIGRYIGLTKSSAQNLIKLNNLDINPYIGYDNMKTVASIQDPNERRKAENAFLEGQSPEMVKAQFTTKSRNLEEDPVKRLLQEKKRIEKTLNNLTKRLTEIEEKLQMDNPE